MQLGRAGGEPRNVRAELGPGPKTLFWGWTSLSLQPLPWAELACWVGLGGLSWGCGRSACVMTLSGLADVREDNLPWRAHTWERNSYKRDRDLHEKRAKPQLWGMDFLLSTDFGHINQCSSHIFSSHWVFIYLSRLPQLDIHTSSQRANWPE